MTTSEGYLLLALVANHAHYFNLLSVLVLCQNNIPYASKGVLVLSIGTTIEVDPLTSTAAKQDVIVTEPFNLADYMKNKLMGVDAKDQKNKIGRCGYQLKRHKRLNKHHEASDARQRQKQTVYLLALLVVSPLIPQKVLWVNVGLEGIE